MSLLDDWDIWVLISMLGVAAVLIVTILIFTLTVVIARLVPATDSTGTALEIVSITLNVILTLSLIYIYQDIRESEAEQEKWMQEQTKILDEQQDLREAQFTPLLSVTYSEESIEEDEITLTCTNNGTGIARGLELKMEIFVTDTNVSETHEAIEGQYLTPLSDINIVNLTETNGRSVEVRKGFFERTGPLRYSERRNEERTRSEPAVKEGGTVSFTSMLRIMRYSGVAAAPDDASPISFQVATEDLVEMGYTVIGYRLIFSYDDILGQEQKSESIGSGYSELEAGMDFEDIVLNSIGEVGRVDYPGKLGEPRYVAIYDPRFH